MASIKLPEMCGGVKLKNNNRSGIAFLKPIFKVHDPIPHDRHLIGLARQGGKVASRQLLRKYGLRVYTVDELAEMEVVKRGQSS